MSYFRRTPGDLPWKADVTRCWLETPGALNHISSLEPYLTFAICTVLYAH